MNSRDASLRDALLWLGLDMSDIFCQRVVPGTVHSQFLRNLIAELKQFLYQWLVVPVLGLPTSLPAQALDPRNI
jgi:hypothetical protein